MIDHLGIYCQDVKKSREFYLKALKPLGLGVIMEFQDFTGIGSEGKPFFWIAPGAPAPTLHIAFAAKDRAQVDAFYEAAIAAGGQDNGKPGLREHYHPGYYGAFVLDPDGYNVEVVCHKPA